MNKIDTKTLGLHSFDQIKIGVNHKELTKINRRYN